VESAPKEIAGKITVKVILETGIIEDLNLIKSASFLASLYNSKLSTDF
jgi:deoxyribose-phosphate aldolase